jgi:hypothetical protein
MLRVCDVPNVHARSDISHTSSKESSLTMTFIFSDITRQYARNISNLYTRFGTYTIITIRNDTARMRKNKIS